MVEGKSGADLEWERQLARANVPQDGHSTVGLDGARLEQLADVQETWENDDAQMATIISNPISSSHSAIQVMINASVGPESIQDIVGTFLVAGLNISLNYDDAANVLTIASTGGVDVEGVQDIVGTMLQAGANISLNYDDALGKLTINGPPGPSDEYIQDLVGVMVQAGTGMTVEYDDATNLMTLHAGEADPKVIKTVHHGLVGTTERPVGADLVYWVGTATPVNGFAWDFWLPENV